MLSVDLGKEVREAMREGRRKGKKTRRKASVAVTRPLECLMTFIISIVTSSFFDCEIALNICRVWRGIFSGDDPSILNRAIKLSFESPLSRSLLVLGSGVIGWWSSLAR